MPLFYVKSAATGDPASGLSGDPEVAANTEPPADRTGLSAPLRRAARSVGGALVGIPRVLALVWRASPGLSIALGVSSALAGLVPAATAGAAGLLINTVTVAARQHAEHGPDRTVFGPVAGLAVHTTTVGAVVLAVALQLVLLLVNAVASAGRNLATELLQERVTQDVQLRVMTHASELELAFFEDADSYDLIRQAQEEAATRPVAMITNLYGGLQSAITFGSVVALLAALNPWVALATLLAPVPAFLADSRYGKASFMISMWSSPIRRRMRYISTLVTTDRYAKEVKLFGLGRYLVDRFAGLGMVYYHRRRRQAAARSAVTTALGTITALVGAGSYLYLALRAVSGRLALGDLVMYAAAAVALQACVQTLFRELTGLYENSLYLQTLYRMLAIRPAITAPERPVAMPDPVRGRLVFERVTFHYPGSAEPALREVSFEIEAGDTVAIVGRNGAGKSTLVKLACRLYDPDEGRILLDGVDLRDLDPDRLRAAFSATFQDYVTYQATAAENIGLGSCDRIDDRAAIETAAVRGGAHPLISGLPRGYDTPLGTWFDRGVELSGGEWQKMALSRGFLRDAPVVLLDEPTAALDPASEYELFGRLRQLAEGRTTIYVSHRFSTVRQADRILLIVDGRLAESGSHQELVARGGQYAQLFHTQASAYVDLPAQPLHQQMA
jgi:ATP-binding cassette subfamily B protein